MELTLVELVGMMAGTGGVTGGLTLAGLRVEIRYLREADKRQQAEADAMRARLESVEKEQITVSGMAERAHHRLDRLKEELSA
ncbi:hypothetical protein [Marinobacter sp.]|uniref:hypothetical protein n=1 Tax=Marinobacter sp. TaxID=50741 RepID=UPI0035C74C4C